MSTASRISLRETIFLLADVYSKRRFAKILSVTLLSRTAVFPVYTGPAPRRSLRRAMPPRACRGRAAGPAHAAAGAGSGCG